MLARLKRFLLRLVPQLPPLSAGQQARAVIGVLLGVLLTGFVSRLALGASPAAPLLIASIGASAVLAFAAPASPLAQPWSLLAGNIVSALVGVTCSLLIPVPLLAGPIAVAGALAGMFLLRCLHPPSAAVALTAVMGDAAVHSLGYAFALWPVGLNSALLVAVAGVYNNLTGHPYPHVPAVPGPNPHKTTDVAPSQRVGVTAADVQAALREGEFLSVMPSDVSDVVRRAEAQAFLRHHGDVRVADIMSRDVAAITADRSINDAWAQVVERQLKALPVVSPENRVIGIVTVSDLMRAVTLTEGPSSAAFISYRTVGDIMTAPARVASPETRVTALVPAMSDEGLHAVPVVDADERLVGIVTQSDLIAAAFVHDASAPPEAKKAARS